MKRRFLRSPLPALLFILLVAARLGAEPPPITDPVATPLERADLAGRLLDEAERDNGTAVRSRLAMKAVSLLRPLVQNNPDDAGLQYLLGRAWALSAEERDLACVRDVRPIEAAIHAYARARQLTPGGTRAQEIATALGDLHGKLGHFERASAEYDHAIALRRAYVRATHDSRDGELARLYDNSAEIFMAQGRLAEAIARYQLAVAYQDGRTGTSPRLALPYFGLGVALDRAGQREKAHRALTRALELDPHLEQFQDSSVYFIPCGEHWYYEALAYLERGQPEQASAAFRRFLEEQPGSRWADRARGHLDELARGAGDGIK
ncbi:MAG TPA: tetratricopeptide repeat protein [Polyangia bacterium]|jgi:tetratricopeptide (TPR) repeat protein|nr:tetratricopeptide repeat protein [Polyangia bacterium]